jgi:hypothetical protein
MLSPTSRGLTYTLALLYAVTGAGLFLLPGQLAPVFAWKVTPFMAMTIGGWCLGNAWLAWITARRWQWRLVYPSLIYLWIFGLLEMGILTTFRLKLNLAHPIAWIYCAALSINVVAAVFGSIGWLRARPALEAFGRSTVTSARIFTVAFVIFAGFLGLYGILAPNGAVGTGGGIFPEVMSDFTLRSFGAFYLALALGATPLLAERNLDTLLHHGFASYALIVAITAAAFVYLRLFDFVRRPGGLAYFGAYLVAGILLLYAFIRYGTGAQRVSAARASEARSE